MCFHEKMYIKTKKAGGTLYTEKYKYIIVESGMYSMLKRIDKKDPAAELDKFFDFSGFDTLYTERK